MGQWPLCWSAAAGFHAVLGGSPQQTDPGALRLLTAVTADFEETATIHLAAPSIGWQNAKTGSRGDA